MRRVELLTTRTRCYYFRHDLASIKAEIRDGELGAEGGIWDIAVVQGPRDSGAGGFDQSKMFDKNQEE